MKYYECAYCHQQIFFDHAECPHCHQLTGYVAVHKDMLSFTQLKDSTYQSIDPKYQTNTYKPCKNYDYYDHQICNWFIASDSPHQYCESCQLTHVIPNLNQPENLIYWKSLEQAKRRFLYLMQRMNIMPRPKKNDHDPYGLRFEFLIPTDDFMVMTGHANGVITLNAIEADVVFRETTRINMGENYRTLLGHFRHESGHYYLDLLQKFYPEYTDEFRQYFGDERQNYSDALHHHYHFGAPKNWQEHFISTYASAHPWEDWAETWAHYLHLMDTLETAYYGGLMVKGNGTTLASMTFKECPIGAQDFEHVLDNWATLTFNLNALNRSMGLADAYPFTLSECVKNKLRFIHKHVLQKAFGITDTSATDQPTTH